MCKQITFLSRCSERHLFVNFICFPWKCIFCMSITSIKTDLGAPRAKNNMSNECYRTTYTHSYFLKLKKTDYVIHQSCWNIKIALAKKDKVKRLRFLRCFKYVMVLLGKRKQQRWRKHYIHFSFLLRT